MSLGASGFPHVHIFDALFALRRPFEFLNIPHQSLKAIFDRAKVPGLASAEGAFELTRGRQDGDHR